MFKGIVLAFKQKMLASSVALKKQKCKQPKQCDIILAKQKHFSTVQKRVWERQMHTQTLMPVQVSSILSQNFCFI